jgi:hypothetical protein
MEFNSSVSNQLVSNNNVAITTTGDSDLLFKVNSIEAIRMTGNNQFLGVGTSSPQQRLDVDNGTVRFSDYGSGTVTGTAAKYLAVESDGDVIEVDAAAGMDAVVANRSYVDNTAALVDLSSGQVYYNTTSNAFVVLP